MTYGIFIPLGQIGIWQVIVIVLLVLLLFGAKKIPELMRGMGRGVKEFKDAVNKDYTDEGKAPGAESAAASETIPEGPPSADQANDATTPPKSRR